MFKSVFASKTVWVNVLTFIAGVVTFFQDHELIVENPDIVAVLGGVLALVNVGLRFLTDKPIAIIPPKETE